MFNTAEMLSYLGLPNTDPRLTGYLSTLGFNLEQELHLESGYRAYVGRPSHGFCLVFTDEGQFLGRRTQPVGSGLLYFSTVFFYSEGKDGYSEYGADLPFKISFEDTRDTVVSKLGEQSWQRLAQDGSRVISDRWDHLAGVAYQLHVTYEKNTGKVSVLGAIIPDRGLDNLKKP